MNITLTADDELVAQARRFAERRRTTLEGLMVDFLRDISQREADVEAYRRRCDEHSGRSEPGWRFDREECHRRGKDE